MNTSKEWATGFELECRNSCFEWMLLISFARNFLSFANPPILTVNDYKIIMIIMITNDCKIIIVIIKPMQSLSAGLERQNHSISYFLAQREASLRWTHKQKLVRHPSDAARNLCWRSTSAISSQCLKSSTSEKGDRRIEKCLSRPGCFSVQLPLLDRNLSWQWKIISSHVLTIWQAELGLNFLGL